MQIDIRPAPTSALNNLKAAGGMRIITLSWALPIGSTTYAAARIFMNTVNDRETAAVYDTVAGNRAIIPVGDEQTRYFWIQEVNIYGRTDGPYTGPASASAKVIIQSSDLADGVFDLNSAKVVGTLSSDKVTGLGALALLDEIGAIDVSAVRGLGLLATLDDIDASQVNNLGALAYADTIAANAIGAGTLAAGVVYAGAVKASQVDATSISAISANLGTFISGDPAGARTQINGDGMRCWSAANSNVVKVGKLL